jgi:hypothetical protein
MNIKFYEPKINIEIDPIGRMYYLDYKWNFDAFLRGTNHFFIKGQQYDYIIYEDTTQDAKFNRIEWSRFSKEYIKLYSLFPNYKDFEVLTGYLETTDFFEKELIKKEMNWIKEKIFNKSEFTQNGPVSEYCFIGSSDPYYFETLLGHKVVKDNKQYLLDSLNMKNIWVKDDYVKGELKDAN